MGAEILTARRRDNQQPRAVEVDANGTVYTTPGVAGVVQDVNIEQVDGNAVVGDGPANNRLETSGYMQVAAAGDTTLRGGAVNDDAVAAATIGQNVRSFLMGWTGAVWIRLLSTVGGVLRTYIADGEDVTQGLTTDAAVTTDVAATISARFRALVNWAYTRMPAALGQGTMVQSLPVVIASDQATIPTVPTDADGDAMVIDVHGFPGVHAEEILIDACESHVANGWAGTADVGSLNNTGGGNAKANGVYCMGLDKTGNTEAFAGAYRTLPSIGLSWFNNHGFLTFWVYAGAGDLANITSVDIMLGQDISNYRYWRTLVADLSAGWNFLCIPMWDWTGALGNGVILTDVDWIEIRFNVTIAATLLSGVRVDDIRAVRSLMTDLQFMSKRISDDNPLPVTAAALGQGTMAQSLPVVIASNQSSVPVTPAATEVHLGEVGGSSNVPAVTPTITAGAYVANDIVGAIQTITDAARTSGKETILQSIVIKDLAKQDVEMVLWFFDRNPVNGTYTDNIPLDIHDTDFGFLVGKVKITADDYDDAADNSAATKCNIGLMMTPSGGANLYCVMQTTEAPTYAGTSDLTILYGFLRD